MRFSSFFAYFTPSIMKKNTNLKTFKEAIIMLIKGAILVAIGTVAYTMATYGLICLVTSKRFVTKTYKNALDMTKEAMKEMYEEFED